MPVMREGASPITTGARMGFLHKSRLKMPVRKNVNKQTVFVSRRIAESGRRKRLRKSTAMTLAWRRLKTRSRSALR
jgi:hypothetical protein